MLSKLGKLLVNGYRLLLTVAVGGLICANISGFVSGIIEFASDAQRAPKPESFRWWVHGGWLVGAGIAFVGEVVRNLRSMNRTSDKLAENPADSRKRTTKKKTKQRRRFSRRRTRSRPSGILGSFGVGSLIGGFLGLMLGGSFLLLWFSLTYSPFAPAGWASSVSVERERIDPTSAHEEPVMTTDHPVVLYAFAGPIVLGATGGGLIAGVAAMIERVRAR